MSDWYEQVFRRALYPAYETHLRRRSTLSWLDAYERDQWYSPEAIAALQFQRLKALIEHCYREVPYYRRRWRELGILPEDIRSMNDYARLPVLTKADIRENFDDLQATSWRGRLLFKRTGGSTGDPLKLGYTHESYERRMAVMWRGYGWAGSRPGRRTLYLWAGAVGTPGRVQQFKDGIYNTLFARRMLNSFEMTESNLVSYADAIDRYRPAIIVGYVNPLARLAKWIVDTGRKVHRPDAVIGAAEALHPHQRDTIARAFGSPVYNTYGCREFMLIASECAHHHGLHVNADHLVLELLDTDGSRVASGPGEVAITDLSNYGMPFIRYLNGDLATASNAYSCPCGRGLPLLERVEGRVLDAIRTPDGRILPGEFFPHMLKDVPGLTRFQLVQRELHRLELSIVRGDGFDDASIAYIRRETAKVLGDEVSLDHRFVDDIPLTRSGKHRVTRSELTGA
ncbi:phenylacetate-CoA ligase [Dyella jiangningensis]|uniref:phenylacetate--CoA ligase family protein n=1 Tax=Dyella sp. AtDHG13 TaxID=1938897 RepID=UPI0008850187|nr:phenylacetate--CoA ligase family protein [Dyella sp. AtDHG13]PXV61435.1 phenylacetate-CoA ligase [Dyella sp. AtDHG13]SDJ90121.1 phenylacetate-CoA ligase [Dyella jiangningensis]